MHYTEDIKLTRSHRRPILLIDFASRALEHETDGFRRWCRVERFHLNHVQHSGVKITHTETTHPHKGKEMEGEEKEKVPSFLLLFDDGEAWVAHKERV